MPGGLSTMIRNATPARMPGSNGSEELEPCPNREGVGRYIREVTDVVDGANLLGRRHARRTEVVCDRYRQVYVEASELRTAIIEHKNDPRPKSGKRHLCAKPEDGAIPLLRDTDGARRKRPPCWEPDARRGRACAGVVSERLRQR